MRLLLIIIATMSVVSCAGVSVVERSEGAAPMLRDPLAVLKSGSVTSIRTTRGDVLDVVNGGKRDYHYNECELSNPDAGQFVQSVSLAVPAPQPYGHGDPLHFFQITMLDGTVLRGQILQHLEMILGNDELKYGIYKFQPDTLKATLAVLEGPGWRCYEVIKVADEVGNLSDNQSDPLILE